ncbi:MAG: benzoate-CoA ligase family protein [candidate division NC10 bacterium]|nr:benzoate-CoA ligase family protein [candidate division NC10 bacterium]
MSVPRVDLPEQFNVATYFVDRNLAEGRGGKAALLHEGKATTYQDVADAMNRFGNALRSLKVEMEDRVALLLLDSPEFVAAFFGAIRIGAVPIPMNTMLRPADYEYMLQDSRAKVLVVHEALWEPLRALRDRIRHVRHIVVVGKAAAPLVSYGELVQAQPPTCEAAETSRDDVAFWLYSSGSTGFPKGAVHLHHDMVYCAGLYARPILGIQAQDITFSAAKLFFAYGLGNNLYFPFDVGATAVLYPGRPLPDKIFEVLAAQRPTIFYGVPTLYAAMLQMADAEEKAGTSQGTGRLDQALQSVRVCVSAGESLPAPIFHRWKDRFGLEILDGIGSTELLHIFISNRIGEVRPGSSGKIVPGYEARIADEEGRTLPQGEVGNLLIKGDSAAAFYWNKHQKTKETMLGEWVKTGDKYYQDPDGYFWYCGRSDDMLKVGGIWVSPVEVENALIGHPAVLECAVVGVQDTDELVKPKAYVVLKQGQQPSPELAEELKAYVKEAIAPYKYPRWIEFIPELPKTATGKIQRFRLRT